MGSGACKYINKLTPRKFSERKGYDDYTIFFQPFSILMAKMPPMIVIKLK